MKTMTYIEKHMPLNDMDKIDSLLEELKSIPGAMNLSTRNEIFQNIKKAKLQMKFQEKYPDSLFTETGNFIPNVDNDKIKISDQDAPNSDKNLYSISYLPNDTLKDQKSIYGTYIEMAFHNFYQTMHHIYALIYGEDLMEVAKKKFERENNNPNSYFDYDFAREWAIWSPMFERLKKEDASELKARFIYLSIKHFPFLKALDAMQNKDNKDGYKKVVDTIKSFSYVMRELRNVYSHYRFIPSDKQESKYKTNIEFLFKLMDILYDGAKREVKTRFGFNDDRMKCAQKYKPNRDNSLRDKYGKVLRTVPNKNFKYQLYTCKDTERVITRFGLVFLTSLFLEKKYAKILSDKTHCIKYSDQEVMCELISVYRIRLHIQKLNVTKEADALALDIINELQRCPKQLFDILPPTEQQKFRIKPASTQDPEVLMIRHQNRFAHLLLKYIDDTKIFEYIRFQVSLGRYFYRFYDKKCIDSTNEKRVRSICKNVHGFGRITEIDKSRDGIYKDMIREYEDIHANTADEKPYITDHHAQYLINNNKVGIYIRKDNDTQSILPELTSDGVRNIVPTCWLSIYELPALAFLLHLYNGDGTRIEEIILSQVSSYHRLFADIKDGKVCPVTNETDLIAILKDYGDIKVTNLPRKLLDYLLSKDVCAQDLFTTWAQSKLQRMIEHTDKLLKNLEKDLHTYSNFQQNKFGKKSYVTIKPGKIANFLAHDMMFFQPSMEDRNNKLTGLNFRILQSVMAVYDGNFEDLLRVMRNAHIIGNANDDFCNPIVMSVCRKKKDFKNITDFYKEYLKERKNYLNNCLNKGDYKSLSFLHPSQNKWKERGQDYYRLLAAKYLTDEYGGVEFTKAIELPRGLFELYIRRELSEMNSMKTMANDYTKNISYLIYGYMKHVMNEDSQTFYDTKRCYQLFNVLYRKSPSDNQVYHNTAEIREMLMHNNQKSIHTDISNYLDRTIKQERLEEEKRCNALLKKMKKLETELKTYKIQDMLLFLLAKRILLKDGDSAIQNQAINQIKLKNIAEGDTLSQKIPFRVKIKSKNGYSKTIRQDDLKLKHYAQFYSIINDRRLPSLLDLIPNSTVMRLDIEAELNNFDKSHPGVLQSVFEYEKQYYDIHSDISNDSSYDIGSMLSDSNLPKESQDEIRKIRNSFAHMSYPNRNVANIGAIELPKKASTMSDKLITLLKSEKNE